MNHATTTSYSQLLRDPRWQRRRLEKLEAAGWRCEKCRCDAKEMHVHHPRYIAGRMPWQYSNDELRALCIDCHRGEHLPAPTPRDHVVERTVESLHSELISTTDRAQRRLIWAAYSAAIRDRSAQQVRRMEMQRGLDHVAL